MASRGSVRDARPLGVALRRVEVWQGTWLVVLDADDERLMAGFHACAADGLPRWTGGRAALPSRGLGAVRFWGAEVVLHSGGAATYRDEAASSARAAVQEIGRGLDRSLPI